METVDDIPFEEPLDLDALATFLARRLEDERARLSPLPKSRLERVPAEVRLAECRYPADILDLLRQLDGSLGRAVTLIAVRQERDAVDLQLRMSLEPANPRAAPLAIVTESDEVHISMGVAGEVEVFGRGDEHAGVLVQGSIRSIVEAVIAGDLREVYSHQESFRPPVVESSKTYLRIDGKWRRTGAMGVRRRGAWTERHYEPYA